MKVDWISIRRAHLYDFPNGQREKNHKAANDKTVSG
jgi:hypothetical protein